MIECKYCKKVFSSVSNLNKHQRTAKFCLRLRGALKNTKQYHCIHCNKKFTRDDYRIYHQNTCQKSHKEDNIDDTPLERIVEKLMKNQSTQVENLIEGLQSTITTIKDLAANSKGTTNNRVLQNMNPITDKDIQEYLEHLTLDFIQDGGKGYANFAGHYPFKDRIMCTDKSRKKLRYKAEDGEIIEDGGGIKLTQRFFKAIAHKNEQLINDEYNSLQKEVETIAREGTAHCTDLAGLLTKATKLQSLLMSCREAAKGEENELTKEFINHLTKFF